MKKRREENTKKLLLKKVKTETDGKRSMPPVILFFILMFFVLVDFITIYPIINRQFLEARYIVILLTIGVAVVLEILPYVLARNLLKDDLSTRQKIIFGLGFVFLIMLIAILFALRWHDAQVAASSSGVHAIIDGVAVQLNEYEFTNDRAAMTILLGLLPGITSVLVFCLGAEVLPVKLEGWREKRNEILIIDEISFYLTCIRELEGELSRDLVAYDKRLLEAKKKELKLIGEELNCIKDLKVAQKLSS